MDEAIAFFEEIRAELLLEGIWRRNISLFAFNITDFNSSRGDYKGVNFCVSKKCPVLNLTCCLSVTHLEQWHILANILL